jgi:hypothetical protein
MANYTASPAHRQPGAVVYRLRNCYTAGMKPIVIAILVVLGLAGLHLLALWMERKGWLYYQHEKPSSNRLGNAFLEIQSILEPGKKIIIEEREREKKEERTVTASDTIAPQ